MLQGMDGDVGGYGHQCTCQQGNGERPVRVCSKETIGITAGDGQDQAADAPYEEEDACSQ